jgi:hypothetical protein
MNKILINEPRLYLHLKDRRSNEIIHYANDKGTFFKRIDCFYQFVISLKNVVMFVAYDWYYYIMATANKYDYIINYSVNGRNLGMFALEEYNKYYSNYTLEMPVVNRVLHYFYLRRYLSKAVACYKCHDRIFRSYDYDYLITGHDCYFHGAAIEAALNHGVYVYILQKYFYNPVYGKEDCQAYFNKNILSRMHVALQDKVDELKNNVSAHEAGKNWIQEVTRDKFSLPHLSRVDMMEDVGIHADSLEMNLDRSEGKKNIILYLHGVSDQYCKWGFDGFRSYLEYFTSLLDSMETKFGEFKLFIKPHPSIYNRNIEFRKKNADLECFDKIYLHAESMGLNIVVLERDVQLSHMAQVMVDPLVVTRWGTVGLEAKCLGLECVCSSIAPYATFCDYIFDCEEGVASNNKCTSERHFYIFCCVIGLAQLNLTRRVHFTSLDSWGHFLHQSGLEKKDGFSVDNFLKELCLVSDEPEVVSLIGKLII